MEEVMWIPQKSRGYSCSVAIAMHSCGDCHAFVWRMPRIQMANATRNYVDRHTRVAVDT